MATNLNYTVEQINRMLYLIDENKNLLPYPYETPLPNGLTDVGDGSILTLERDGTYSNESFILSSKCILPAGEYTVSLDITSILEELAISSNFKLKIETGNGKEITTTNSCKTFNLTENTAVIVSLIVPDSFVAGLLIKPQIEKGGAKTTWVPNMNKIGTYVDRRFNGLNTKIKVLTERVNSVPVETDIPTVAVECSEIGADNTFTANIVVYNNPGIAGYQYTVKFDNSLIQIVDVVRDEDDVPESAFPAEATLNIDEGTAAPSTYSELKANASRTKAWTKNGVLLTIKFKVVAEFEQLELALADVHFIDQATSKVNFDIVSGIVNKNPVMYGDLNGDGRIDATDSVILAQYLANWDVEYNATAADCNGDGDINAKDAVLLAQYLAGWAVTLGSPSKGLAFQEDTNSMTCVITGIGTCTDMNINIPATISGSTVVGIASSAFSNSSSLTSVTIPNSVTSIGDYAFEDCGKLTTIICGFAENEVAGAPWGAKSATIKYAKYTN